MPYRTKKRECNSHKEVDTTTATVLPTSSFPEPRKQLLEPGRTEAAVEVPAGGLRLQRHNTVCYCN